MEKYLTDEQIRDSFHNGPVRSKDQWNDVMWDAGLRAIARAAADNAVAWLASQCGDDPCVGCRRMKMVEHGKCIRYQIDGIPLPSETCGDRREYQGQLSGYAKCEAEKTALAWEIVGFIRELSPATKAIADTVERWLASRGIERP